MAGWLIPGAVVALFLVVQFAIAQHNTRRMIERTKAARPNPTESQFVALLEGDVGADVAQFVWGVAAPCVQPELTPHPDDHLWRDLPIDEEEPLLDWWVEFAALRGIDVKDWPEWPDGRDCTVRNYSRWLDLGLQQAR